MKNDIRTILKHVAHLEAAIDSIGDGDDLYEAGLSSLDTIQLMHAIETVVADPALHTRDLGGNATTAQVTGAVCERLAKAGVAA